MAKIIRVCEVNLFSKTDFTAFLQQQNTQKSEHKFDNVKYG